MHSGVLISRLAQLATRCMWARVTIHVSKLQTCRPLHGLGKLRSILALYCSHRGQWFIFPSGKGRLWKRKKTWPSRTHHKWQENGFEEPVPVYPMSTRSCPAYSLSSLFIFLRKQQSRVQGLRSQQLCGMPGWRAHSLALYLSLSNTALNINKQIFLEKQEMDLTWDLLTYILLCYS